MAVMETAVLISDPGFVQIAATAAAFVKDKRDNNSEFHRVCFLLSALTSFTFYKM